MRPPTCIPRIFAVLAATILFVALATPIWLTAQVEQEHSKDQTNYFVKNLDTLEGTGTIVECSSAGSGVADNRRADPDTDQPTGLARCEVSQSTYKLTGRCVIGIPYGCSFKYEPEYCPPGARPRSLEHFFCSGRWQTMDSRACY